MGDFLEECMSSVGVKDTAGFIAGCCDHCRNPQCGRAKWAGDKFGQRVSTQVDRLFHSEQADPKSSRYEHLQDFKDMFKEAMQLEIADRRGDWNIPEIPDFSKPKQAQPKHMIWQKEPAPEPEPIEILPPPALLVHREPEGEPATIVEHPKAIQIKPTGMVNTSVPVGGIMLGGPPNMGNSERKPGWVADPWAAPPPNNFVKPGATIKMGGLAPEGDPKK